MQEAQEQKEPQQKQQQQPILSYEQIQSFINDGVLVVDNVLSSDEIEMAQNGLHDTLRNKYGIDTTDLYNTGHFLTRLSSTNGSGGVLDIYYEAWQIQLFATNPKLFHMTTELWKYMYLNDCSTSDPNHDSLSFDDVADDKKCMWHPYGSFDYRKGYMYLDRVGYRLPTQLAYDIAEKQQQQQQDSDSGNVPHVTSSKKKKVFPIQRSLTPHFDCCPSNIYKISEDSIKWRPIQCFISLTDTLEPNHGGFEAVKGFHHEFHVWSQHGTRNIMKETKSPAPCIGEYAHLRPKEDHDIYQRVQHIPVSAGSAVFWDNRIPHANAYRHDGTIPRAVVYCSFLPDVPINRQYVKQQLQNWIEGRFPSGNQWINHSNNDKESITETKRDGNEDMTEYIEEQNQIRYQNILQMLSTPLARSLAGIDDSV